MDALLLGMESAWLAFHVLAAVLQGVAQRRARLSARTIRSQCFAWPDRLHTVWLTWRIQEQGRHSMPSVLSVCTCFPWLARNPMQAEAGSVSHIVRG